MSSVKSSSKFRHGGAPAERSYPLEWRNQDALTAGPIEGELDDRRLLGIGTLDACGDHRLLLGMAHSSSSDRLATLMIAARPPRREADKKYAWQFIAVLAFGAACCVGLVSLVIWLVDGLGTDLKGIA
jgi:hypothetical protein